MRALTDGSYDVILIGVLHPRPQRRARDPQGLVTVRHSDGFFVAKIPKLCHNVPTMQFHPDIAPAMRNQKRSAAETQNEKNMVQFALMGRYPQGELEWSLRYNAAYRQLFHEDGFYELVLEAHSTEDQIRKNELLSEVQDRLEALVQKQPELIEKVEGIEAEIEQYRGKTDDQPEDSDHN